MKRSVRWLAWYEAILGAVVAVCGILAAFLPLIVLGTVLTGVGVWNLLRPSVTGVIVDGIAVLLAGLFSCAAGWWVENARATSAAHWFFTGVMQLVWGVRRLALYPSARAAPNDPDAIARLETIVRELEQRAKDDPGVVEFRTGRWRRHRNRLGLYAEGAVGLLEHQAVRLERRSDLWIEAAGTTALGRSIKVRIQMSDLTLTGEMPADHFERFERWKLGQVQARPVAA